MWLYDSIVNAIPFMRATEDTNYNLFFDAKSASLYLEGLLSGYTRR